MKSALLSLISILLSLTLLIGNPVFSEGKKTHAVMAPATIPPYSIEPHSTNPHSTEPNSVSLASKPFSVKEEAVHNGEATKADNSFKADMLWHMSVIIPKNTIDSSRPFSIGGSYTHQGVNSGFAFQNIDTDAVNNLYTGIGFGHLLQTQLGYGNEGMLGRLRSDWNIKQQFPFLKRIQSKDSSRSGLVVVLSMERYKNRSSKKYDHSSIGFGFRY